MKNTTKIKDKKLPYKSPLIIKVGSIEGKTHGAMSSGAVDTMGPNTGIGFHPS